MDNVKAQFVVGLLFFIAYELFFLVCMGAWLVGSSCAR
jgi:hypothetical protein